MNKLSFYITTAFLMVLSVSIQAADPIKGKEKSAACVSCHGQDGISLSPIWPHLAGQHASYLA